MRRFLRENGLSIVLLASFFLLLVGQSWVGRAEYNDERRERELQKQERLERALLKFPALVKELQSQAG